MSLSSQNKKTFIHYSYQVKITSEKCLKYSKTISRLELFYSVLDTVVWVELDMGIQVTNLWTQIWYIV